MKNILITGLPGVGKTTLIQKVVCYLKNNRMNCDGFYTEEVRLKGTRIGFDVVTLDGKKGTLARKGPKSTKGLSVGQYTVHLQEFEKLALPVFDKAKPILIIDEIGKMEMFSQKFQDLVKRVIDDDNVQVIATVPIKSGPPFIKQLKENRNWELITVTISNRDYIINDVLALIK